MNLRRSYDELRKKLTKNLRSFENRATPALDNHRPVQFNYYYFASAAVAVDSSHMTASSSANSWSRFSPLSNCVSGHVSTMWFIVCRWPQSEEGDWVRPHLRKLARHGPWPVRKRFIRDQYSSIDSAIDKWRNKVYERPHCTDWVLHPPPKKNCLFSPGDPDPT